MNKDDIFTKMKEVIEHPSFNLLKSNRNDFEVFDKAMLDWIWNQESSMLWVVREHGTHLVPLHVHERLHDEARAAMNTGGEFKLFHLTPNGVKAIDQDRAEDLMARMRWENCRGQIRKDDLAMAVMGDIVCVENQQGKKEYSVNFSSDIHLHEYTKGDLIAIRQLGEMAIMSHAQSLFVHIKSIQLDRQDIMDMVARNQVRETQPAESNQYSLSM